MKPISNSSDSAEKAAPLRVAVIEDDRVMRALLEKLIAKQADLTLCGIWGSGEEALAALHALGPDVRAISSVYI